MKVKKEERGLMRGTEINMSDILPSVLGGTPMGLIRRLRQVEELA